MNFVKKSLVEILNKGARVTTKPKFGSFPPANQQSGVINIGNVSPHVVLKNGFCVFSYVVSMFQYPLLKFVDLSASELL